MKASILTLIEDNIVNLKLVSTLEDLGIDASLYNLNSPSVVFDLIGIKCFENRDKLFKKYFDLLEQGKTIDFTNSKEELKIFAEKVYAEMINLKISL